MLRAFSGGSIYFFGFALYRITVLCRLQLPQADRARYTGCYCLLFLELGRRRSISLWIRHLSDAADLPGYPVRPAHQACPARQVCPAYQVHPVRPDCRACPAFPEPLQETKASAAADTATAGTISIFFIFILLTY